MIDRTDSSQMDDRFDGSLSKGWLSLLYMAAELTMFTTCVCCVHTFMLTSTTVCFLITVLWRQVLLCLRPAPIR